VFGYELGEDTDLRLLEERHAEQLADLTDRNREHLRIPRRSQGTVSTSGEA
jgi:hypothetical protein